MNNKVAIWGSYAYNNYGDELMALQYAVYLKQLGAQPVVYKLDPVIGNKFGISTAETSDELLREARFCIFGGGSLLSGHKPTKGWYARQKEQEYREFCAALQKHSIPLYYVSIGGDGVFSDNIEITSYRDELLRGPWSSGATVRQKEDVDFVREKYGISSSYYPDVLLSVGSFWNISSREKSEANIVKIGVNRPSSDSLTIGWAHLVARFVPGVKVCFISTVREDKNRHPLRGEYLPDKEGAHIQFYPYSDPLEMLNRLRQLDVVITGKLHIGLTALALGVPYICIAKSGKAGAFLHSIGAGWAYWGDMPKVRKLGKLIGLLKALKSDSLVSRYDWERINRQKEESHGHMEFIKYLWEKHSASVSKI